MPLPINSGISFGFFPSYSQTSPPPANLTGSAGWFDLTDHNRQPLEFGYDNVEKDMRMANGFMRKFVIAQKRTIAMSWQNVPSITSASSIIKTASGGLLDVVSNLTVDGKYGAAWIKKFYEQNIFIPIWIKITHTTTPAASGTYSTGFTPSVSYNSQFNSASYFSLPTTTNPVGIPTGSAQPEIFYGYMTDLSYTVEKRYSYTDYVNLSLKFVEA